VASVRSSQDSFAGWASIKNGPIANGQSPEQQRLLDLIVTMPVEEAEKVRRRPSGCVRSMLHRLGMGGKTGREWFTKFSLSRALHTRPDEIQKWIDLGCCGKRGRLDPSGFSFARRPAESLRISPQAPQENRHETASQRILSDSQINVVVVFPLPGLP